MRIASIAGAGALALSAAAFGLGGCTATTGFGETAGPPVGTVFSFKQVKGPPGTPLLSFRHTVVSVKGHTAVYRVSDESRNPTNDTVRLYRGIFSYAYWRPGKGWVEYKFDRAAVAPLWPLKVGNKVSFPVTFGYAEAKTVAEGKAKWKAAEKGRITFEVRRKERVTVRAGTFDTFVIHRLRVFTRIAPPHRSLAVERVSWYAPKLGYVVKQTAQDMRVSRGGRLTPMRPITVIELQRIDRPGRQ